MNESNQRAIASSSIACRISEPKSAKMYSHKRSNIHQSRLSIPQRTLCRRCRKPTTNQCSGCNEPVYPGADHTKTYYCSPECKRADRPNHEDECNIHHGRRQLYRGASLLQETFYLYREALFDRSVEAIAQEENSITIFETWNGQGWLDFFHPFPNELCAEGNVKKSVLTYRAGSTGVAWFKDMIEYILKGKNTVALQLCLMGLADTANLDIAHKIREIPYVWEVERIKVTCINADGSSDAEELNHTALRIELPNDACLFALDLSGAQYGFLDPLLPLEGYIDDRVESCYPLRDFGQTYEELDEKSNLRGFDNRLLGFNQHVASLALKPAVVSWERKSGKNIQELLDSSSSSLEVGKKEILGVVSEKLGTLMKEVRRVLAEKDARKEAMV